MRRYGRGFFELPGGRRLMAPESIAVIEREYLRFGVVGLFVARFLPGIRAVVPPFAGMFRIPAWRVFLVIALVSGIWYGAITWIGAIVGGEFERVQEILHQMGRTTAHRRRRPRGRHRALPLCPPPAARGARHRPRSTPPSAPRPIPASPSTSATPRSLSSRSRTPTPGLAPRNAPASRMTCASAGDSRPRASTPARPAHEEEGRLQRLGQRLSGEVERERRLDLIEQMWQSLFADRTIDSAQEAWLLARAAELLGLAPEDVRQVRSRLTTHAR